VKLLVLIMLTAWAAYIYNPLGIALGVWLLCNRTTARA
jgi:hypothetical protein